MDTFQREGGAMQMIDPIRKESSGANTYRTMK